MKTAEEYLKEYVPSYEANLMHVERACIEAAMEAYARDKQLGALKKAAGNAKAYYQDFETGEVWYVDVVPSSINTPNNLV